MDKRFNYLIKTLLLYIKKEMEIRGCCVGMEKYHNSYWFNAQFEYKDYLPCLVDSNKKPRIVPDSEDITKLKSLCNISEEELDSVLKYCVANEYLKKDICYTNLYALKRKGKTLADKYEKEILKNADNLQCILTDEIPNIEQKLTEIILVAKYSFLTGDLQVAVEKIWDAFERLKTIIDSNKKTSVYKLSAMTESNIISEAVLEEFKILTKIGNECQIRHFETKKIELKNPATLKYLFIKVYSLILFSINNIYKKQI